MQPVFLALNGVDETVTIKELHQAIYGHPVELGIAYSINNAGVKPRYPSIDKINEILSHPDLKDISKNLHLCGDIARYLATFDFKRYEDKKKDKFTRTEYTNAETIEACLKFIREVDLYQFNRIQFNVGTYDVSRILENLSHFKILSWIVLPCNDANTFPSYNGCDWLYDTSKGKGTAPDQYPSDRLNQNFYKNTTRLVGYAGGINSGNVTSVINKINKANNDFSINYYLDVESGIRNEKDDIDVKKIKDLITVTYFQEQLNLLKDIRIFKTVNSGSVPSIIKLIRAVEGHASINQYENHTDISFIRNGEVITDLLHLENEKAICLAYALCQDTGFKLIKYILKCESLTKFDKEKVRHKWNVDKHEPPFSMSSYIDQSLINSLYKGD
jgi:phosphoribosylanthranilate isomerase